MPEPLLCLGDTAGDVTEMQTDPPPPDPPSPHLHLVYVGRVVSAAAQLGGGLAAAVGHHSAVALPGADPDALGPVGGAVAAAALELMRDGQSRRAEITGKKAIQENIVALH